MFGEPFSYFLSLFLESVSSFDSIAPCPDTLITSRYANDKFVLDDSIVRLHLHQSTSSDVASSDRSEPTTLTPGAVVRWRRLRVHDRSDVDNLPPSVCAEEAVSPSRANPIAVRRRPLPTSRRAAFRDRLRVGDLLRGVPTPGSDVPTWPVEDGPSLQRDRSEMSEHSR